MIFIITAQSVSTLRQVYGGTGFVTSVVVGVGVSGLYILMGLKLFRFRDAIDEVVAAEGELSTVANAVAVERQQEWWLLIGRVTIAAVVLYGLLLLGLASLAGSR